MSQHVTGSSLHAESIVNKHPLGLVMWFMSGSGTNYSWVMVP